MIKSIAVDYFLRKFVISNVKFNRKLLIHLKLMKWSTKMTQSKSMSWSHTSTNAFSHATKSKSWTKWKHLHRYANLRKQKIYLQASSIYIVWMHLLYVHLYWFLFFVIHFCFLHFATKDFGRLRIHVWRQRSKCINRKMEINWEKTIWKKSNHFRSNCCRLSSR